MVKCNKGQLRRLKRALRGRKHPALRQRIQMVLLRESGMTQPAVAEAMGVSLSTVNRAHMAYDPNCSRPRCIQGAVTTFRHFDGIAAKVKECFDTVGGVQCSTGSLNQESSSCPHPSLAPTGGCGLHSLLLDGHAMRM